MSRVPLFDTTEDQTLRIQGELAKKIGFNESVVLMQVEYLISISTNEEIDGNLWTYQSLDDLKSKYFPWWSIATISRIVKSLEKQGVIFIGSFNKRKGDKTQWFALNFEKIIELGCVKLNASHTIFQNAIWAKQTEQAEADNPETVPIFQIEKSSQVEAIKAEKEPTILQNDDTIFHSEKPIFQIETTLPETTTEISTETTKRESPPPEFVKELGLALRDCCGINPRMMTNNLIHKLNEATKVLLGWEATPILLREFREGYWWGTGPPNPQQVCDEWGKFLNVRARGYQQPTKNGATNYGTYQNTNRQTIKALDQTGESAREKRTIDTSTREYVYPDGHREPIPPVPRLPRDGLLSS